MREVCSAPGPITGASTYSTYIKIINGTTELQDHYTIYLFLNKGCNKIERKRLIVETIYKSKVCQKTNRNARPTLCAFVKPRLLTSWAVSMHVLAGWINKSISSNYLLNTIAQVPQNSRSTATSRTTGPTVTLYDKPFCIICYMFSSNRPFSSAESNKSHIIGDSTCTQLKKNI